MKGGGVSAIYGADAELVGCLVAGNTAGFHGGGIYSDESSPTVAFCTIEANRAGYDGGGICCWDSEATVRDSRIVGNSTVVNGGGFYCEESVALLENCRVLSNASDLGGGGIGIDESRVTVRNGLIAGNSSLYDGGGIYCNYRAALDLVNATLFDNRAGSSGGGLHSMGSSVAISSSILWGDAAPEGPEVAIGIPLDPSTVTVRFSDVGGGQAEISVQEGSSLLWLDGNLDADPGFAGDLPEEGYLSQRAAGQAFDSPCLDAGDPAAEAWGWNLLTTRTDELPDAGVADMGFHHASSLCTDRDRDRFAAEGGLCGAADCDDLDAGVHPGSVELCDNLIDEDCDGAVDCGDPDCAASPSCVPAHQASVVPPGRYPGADPGRSEAVNYLAFYLLLPWATVLLLRALARGKSGRRGFRPR